MLTARAKFALPFSRPRATWRTRGATIATLAHDALLREVETAPKPGLVSRIDSGSHDDMDANTFRRSAAAIRPHFAGMAEAGARGCAMSELRVVGLEAEAAMFAATGGINTHRGAIFGLGLLVAAAGARSAGLAGPNTSLGTIVAQRWSRGIVDGPVLLRSHGSAARRRYGAGGARAEAAQGFPTVYEVGLPALREGAELESRDAEGARVHACFALIAALEDTNLLHRGGREGLAFAQRTAREFLDAGGVGQPDWRARSLAIHREFVARRLSPGGAADLLAMSVFVNYFETGLVS